MRGKQYFQRGRYTGDEQSIICSKTTFVPYAHAQTISCRQLLGSYLQTYDFTATQNCDKIN